MNLLILHDAVREFERAVDYYNNERPGLGYEFAAEVRNAFNRIKRYPESWPFITRNIRKCVVNRFPFSILYHSEKEQVIVVAVMHMKRKPGYWKMRIE
jgi:hypothetical protein